MKHRVTTDDSMEEEGADSRNSSLPREDWPDVHLPRVHTLARAVAILKAAGHARSSRWLRRYTLLFLSTRLH